MSSMAHELGDDTANEHRDMGLVEFTRLEKLLLFAVITECERCISSEGYDCFDLSKTVSCPFVNIREEYRVMDIPEWKELVG